MIAPLPKRLAKSPDGAALLRLLAKAGYRVELQVTRDDGQPWTAYDTSSVEGLLAGYAGERKPGIVGVVAGRALARDHAAADLAAAALRVKREIGGEVHVVGNALEVTLPAGSANRATLVAVKALKLEVDVSVYEAARKK